MSNPTVGTLRMSNGLEILDCNPAFLWSSDSRYLAVPQWIHRFGLFLRQRLLMVDVDSNSEWASRFTHWLLEPRGFADSRLEIWVSSSFRITWQRKKPIVLVLPYALEDFVQLPDFAR